MLQPPGHLYTREELERMKRCDIQRLCKDYGVRANMKTESLIELLLDTIHHSSMSLLVPVPAPTPAPQPTIAPMLQRRRSTRSTTGSRSSSLRTRDTSGSSVIVHDDPSGRTSRNSSTAASAGSSQVTFSDNTTSRSRKAKESQLRLGVGRPTVVGGTGPRAVTRSLSLSKQRRVKGSRSVKPVEETIQEEPEHSTSVEDPVQTNPLPLGGQPNEGSPGPDVLKRIERLESFIQDAEVRQHSGMIRALQVEFQKIKQSCADRDAEMSHLKSEVEVCRRELAVVRSESSRITFLETQMRALKENLSWAQASPNAIPSTSTPANAALGLQKEGGSRRVSFPLGNNDMNTKGADDSRAAMKTPARPAQEVAVPGTLGKRHRDLNDTPGSEASESENLSEKALEKRPARPMKKKAKFSAETNEVPSGSGSQPATGSGALESASSASSEGGLGTPPPTTHLPEFFTESFDNHVQDIGADRSDFVGPDGVATFGTDSLFQFNFSAISSTPRDDNFGYFGSVPFSPGSAAKAKAARRGLSGDGPSDNHHPMAPTDFGMRRVSSSTRPRSPSNRLVSAGFDFNQYLNPDCIAFAMGTHPPAEAPARQETNDPPIPPAPVPLPLGNAAETPARPVQRTMYGTEMQNDTRFGDFGRDGIASATNANYWLNGLY